MSETATLDLVIGDKASATAKRIADSLDRVQRQADQAQAKLIALRADPKAYQDMVRMQQRLRAEQDKLKGGWFNWAGPTGAGRIFSASVGQLLADGAEKIGSALIAAARSTVEMIVNGVKFAFDAGSRAEQMHLGYRLSLGEKGAGESLSDIQRFSKLTAFGEARTESMFLPLRRAGFDQQGARSAYAAALDIAAGRGNGGSQEEVEGALETLKRIKLKGGVTDKLLLGMGVSIPEFFESLSKKQGLSKESAKKLAESGQIDPQILLNTIYEGIEKRQGGILGTGGVAAGKTMGARLQKLKDLPEEYIRKLADSPAWVSLSEKVGKVLEGLSPDSPRGKAILDKLTGAFNVLADAAEKWLTPENMDLFVAKIKSSVDTARELFTIFKDIGGVVLDVVRYIDRMIKGYRELKDDLEYAAKGGEDAAGPGSYKNRVGGRLDVIKQTLTGGPGESDDENFGQKVFDFVNKKNRGGGSNPAPASQPVPMSAAEPRTSSGKVIKVDFHPGSIQVQAAPGEDPDKTHQRAGEAVRRHVADAVERATQEAGG